MSQSLNRLNNSDSNLITTQNMKDVFGSSNDVSELHIFDLNDNLLTSDYNYLEYKQTPIQTLEVDPTADCIKRNYEQGSFKLYYNFFRNVSKGNFFIKVISTDRKEIALSSNNLSNSDIESIYNILKDNFEVYNYLKTYIINFTQNKTALIVNVALDTTNDVYEIYLKLYEPLSKTINEKQVGTIQQEVIPTNYVEIDLVKETNSETNVIKLEPNFDINVDDKIGNTTDYLDITTLSSDITYSNPLTSLFANKSLKINIDFEDFNDFINYSSVESRINNFVSKLSLIETYNTNITNGIGQVDYNKSKIRDIITNFDLYEYFLYTSSSTKSYPKDVNGNVRPTNSIYVTEWLETILEEASAYDNFNSNKLLNNIPAYLLVDERNEPLYHFINMMGHQFDNIWVYIKKMSDLYVANNNMNKGISPSMVEDVLKSFGVKLYNSLSNVELSNTEKYEYNSEIYKRIYHNLPQLFKNKGTLNGLRQLINIFGIPETIFKIYEYGSLDNSVNNLQHTESIFNYALDINRVESVTIPFKQANTNDTLKSFTFRMKLNSKPLQSTKVIGDFDPRDFNQNDFYYVTTQGDFDGRDFKETDFKTNIIVVDRSETLLSLYTGNSTFLTVELENFDDEVCRLYIQHNGVSSLQIEVDIYNNKFNTFYLQREYQPLENKTKYTLKVVKEGIVSETYLYITNEQTTINPNSYSVKLFDTLDCNVQSLELRNDYLTNEQLVARFYNPSSFEGVYDNLVTYLPLGTNLYTYNHSTITSQQGTTFNNFPNKINYVTNYEQVCYNSFGTTATKRVNDKIKIKTNDTFNTLLSSYTSILTNDEKEFENHKFLDVVFSPNFEQDDDIIAMFGNLRMDDYLGSPDGLYDTSYPSLEVLKREYLKRTIGQYNIKDYFNLIQHIDNSLFKMIYDFVPFSKNTSSGILVKQNILHRNKIGSLKPNSVAINSFDIVYDNMNFEMEMCKDFEFTFSLKDLVTPIDKKGFKYSPFNQDHYHNNTKFDSVVKVGLEGSKLSGLKLNEYTKGDITLGKTPVMESYVDKVGLFTSVVNNKIFNKKSTIELKYLVDKNGNFTDLNSSNNNFYDIQNYFKKGDNLNVALFDTNKYSNQKTLNGLKPIFSSGFNYSPCFYFSPKDRFLNFDNLTENTSFLRYIEPSDRDISNKKFVYDLFPKVDLDTTGTFTVGSSVDKRFSSYQIQESKQYQFNLDLDLLIKPTKNDFSFKYKLSTYKNYINDDSIIDSVTYTYNPLSPVYDKDGNEIPISQFGSTKRNLEIPVEGEESMEVFNNYWSNSVNSLDIKNKPIYKQGRIWKWDNIVHNDFNDTSGLSPNYRIYTSDDTDAYKSGKVYEVKNSITKVVEKLYDEYFQYDSETINISIPIYEAQFWFLGNILVGNRGIITKGVSATQRKSNSFSKYDKIYFVLEQLETNNVTSNSITLLKYSSIYTTTNNSSYDLGTTDEVIKSLKTNMIVLNRRLYDYLGATTFNPTNSSLYKTYGDVDEIFSIRSGDFIYIKDGKTKNYYYLEINQVILNDNDLTITLFNTIPSYVVKENIEECVFIKRSKDETNIVIDFKKKDGDTSYGFIIPSNINPTFMKNIDVITKQVNTKLLKDNIYK